VPVEPARSLILLETWAASQLVEQLMRRELEAEGVPIERYGLLSAIAVLGPLTPSDLATRLGYRPTTLSEALQLLFEAGLVEKRPNPDDGRSYLLRATREGEARVRRARKGINRALDALERHLERPLDEAEQAVVELRRALAAAVDDPDAGSVRAATPSRTSGSRRA
jgi:DNA-binding MarR family transcriptional regulator